MAELRKKPYSRCDVVEMVAELVQTARISSYSIYGEDLMRSESQEIKRQVKLTKNATAALMIINLASTDIFRYGFSRTCNRPWYAIGIPLVVVVVGDNHRERLNFMSYEHRGSDCVVQTEGKEEVRLEDRHKPGAFSG